MPFFENKTTILQSRRENEPFEFPLHIHTPVEFIYINKGQLRIDYIDNSFTLSEGDFAVIFPYTVHGYCTITPTVDYTIAIGNHNVHIDFEHILSQYHPTTPIICSADLPKDIPLLMNELVTLNDCNNQAPLIKAIISLILARILPLMQLKLNHSKYESNLQVRAISYVMEHFQESISLDTVANALGVSRFVVSRLFSSTIHMTFVKYINSLRIDRAKNLLENTNMPIVDIAFDCGYETLRTFNRTFKEHTEITPLQYRSQKNRK